MIVRFFDFLLLSIRRTCIERQNSLSLFLGPTFAMWIGFLPLYGGLSSFPYTLPFFLGSFTPFIERAERYLVTLIILTLICYPFFHSSLHHNNSHQGPFFFLTSLSYLATYLVGIQKNRTLWMREKRSPITGENLPQLPGEDQLRSIPDSLRREQLTEKEILSSAWKKEREENLSAHKRTHALYMQLREQFQEKQRVLNKTKKQLSHYESAYLAKEKEREWSLSSSYERCLEEIIEWLSSQEQEEIKQSIKEREISQEILYELTLSWQDKRERKLQKTP